jgi:hypothetical protein
VDIRSGEWTAEILAIYENKSAGVAAPTYPFRKSLLKGSKVINRQQCAFFRRDDDELSNRPRLPCHTDSDGAGQLGSIFAYHPAGFGAIDKAGG